MLRCGSVTDYFPADPPPAGIRDYVMAGTEKGTGTFATGIAAVWASSRLEPAAGRWRRAADGSVLERITLVMRMARTSFTRDAFGSAHRRAAGQRGSPPPALEAPMDAIGGDAGSVDRIAHRGVIAVAFLARRVRVGVRMS